MSSVRSGMQKIVERRYAGLGAALGVPQSALEAVTSLDPKDYIYPQPSAEQQQVALQQLSSLSMYQHARGGSSLGGHVGAYKGALPPTSAGDASFQGNYDNRAADAEDPALQGIFNLDLDVDCLKMLTGKDDPPTASGATSDRSTCTWDEEKVVGTRTEVAPSPGSPLTATSPNQASAAAAAEDDDDGDLLLAHAPSFQLEDAEVMGAGSFALRHSSAPFTAANTHFGDASAMKRMKTGESGNAGAGRHARTPQLKLCLNYEAAAAMINTALDVNVDRKVPGPSSESSADDTGSEMQEEEGAGLMRNGSLKRLRSVNA